MIPSITCLSHLLWGNILGRALQRAVRKYPTLKHDIEETLSLLPENAFAPPLATHKEQWMATHEPNSLFI